MKKQIVLCSICLALVGMMGCNPTSDSIQVSHLQVEMKDNPQGIDVEHPRFPGRYVVNNRIWWQTD